jgi:hypothetical protein
VEAGIHLQVALRTHHQLEEALDATQVANRAAETKVDATHLATEEA